MSGKPIRSTLSKWIFLPFLIILVAMMLFGIYGKKLVVAPEQTQGKYSATGQISNLDTANKTFTLTIPEDAEISEGEPLVWEVDFEKAKEFHVIVEEGVEAPTKVTDRHEIDGLEFEHDKVILEDGTSMMEDGMTMTVAGSKKAKKGTMSASVLHLGGIFNEPEYHQRHEPREIYKTAVILCIACVGLGESNFFWFYLILGSIVLVLLLWLMMRIIQKRGASA